MSIQQDSHKDSNFKSKYNGKSSNGKMQRQNTTAISERNHSVQHSLHGHFSGIHFLNVFLKTEG